MINCTRRRLGALALWAVVIGLAACGTPQTATSLVAQGLKAQLAGDDSTAQSTYLQAIKLDPNNAVAHYDLGTVYDRQGNRSEAVAEYTAAVVIDPAFTDALFNLAVDTAGAEPARAQDLYLKVVTLQPSFAAAWLNVGFILAGDGKTATARADWARAASLDPTLASRVPVALTSPTPKP
jgi:tetratricopeptide (TPR) repeat protein